MNMWKPKILRFKWIREKVTKVRLIIHNNTSEQNIISFMFLFVWYLPDIEEEGQRRKLRCVAL